MYAPNRERSDYVHILEYLILTTNELIYFNVALSMYFIAVLSDGFYTMNVIICIYVQCILIKIGLCSVISNVLYKITVKRLWSRLLPRVSKQINIFETLLK